MDESKLILQYKADKDLCVYVFRCGRGHSCAYIFILHVSTLCICMCACVYVCRLTCLAPCVCLWFWLCAQAPGTDHCWWNVSICPHCKISRGYKQVIYWPGCFSLDQRTPTQSILSATTKGYTRLACSITACQSRHQQKLFVCQNVQRCHAGVSGWGSKQTLFLSLYFTHCYHIWDEVNWN